jgi:hypothetical protein
MKATRRAALSAAFVVCALAAGIGLQPPAAHAAVCAGRPADRTLAQLFMESNAVATGTLAVTKGAVRKAFSAGDFLDLPFVGLKSIAGKVPARLSVKIYAERRRGGVPPEQMEKLAGEPVLVFLVRGRDGEFYLTRGEKALQPAAPATIGAAERERDRQWAILRAWKPDRSLPHYSEVKALVTELAAIRRPAQGNEAAYDEARARQDAIFVRLEKLGRPAVPAIVAHLDDRRPLAVEQLALANRPPDPIEAIRTYGPEQIVDALAATLNQVAGQNFDAIYSGGSEAQRRSAIAAWRIYADDLVCYGR